MSKLLESLACASIFLYTLTKGHFMEGRIDKIDVKREHKELIALYYRMELRALIQRIVYEHQTARVGIR